MKKVNIEAPIFIIGCPRSGTTITMDILSRHEELGWVSNYVNRKPQKLQYSIINRVFSNSIFGGRLYLNATGKLNNLHSGLKRRLPTPVEPWKFWNYYLSNFQWNEQKRPQPWNLTENDIEQTEITTIREVVKSILKYQGKSRFISKYTDFPRMKYLLEAFPNAKFVHMVRDGRAVAASYHTINKKGNFKTWQEHEFWVKAWPENWQSKWNENYKKSEISFYMFQWKLFVNHIREESKSVSKDQYLEIKYSDLMSFPKETTKEIFEFSGLKVDKKVNSYIDSIELKNMNSKWEKNYSNEDKAIMDEILSI